MNATETIRHLFLFTVLNLAGGQALAAQGPGGPDSEDRTLTAEQALEQVRAELTTTQKRWYTIARARWSYPQKISAGIGAMIAEQPRDADCHSSCALKGWMFQVEPGLKGIQGSIGWGKLVGETGRNKRMMRKANFAWSVRAAVLRTWGDSPLTPKKQTLVGVEGSFSIISINLSLGIMRSLASDPFHDWRITGGLGLGF